MASVSNRHWSHDDETRAVLGECCFGVWKQ